MRRSCRLQRCPWRCGWPGRTVRTWSRRSGRSGPWSRRSDPAAPCTCCPRRTCRGGRSPSARCPRGAATRPAYAWRTRRPTRSLPPSTHACGRVTAPPRSSTSTSPRPAGRGRPRRRCPRSAPSGPGGARRCGTPRPGACCASAPTGGARSPTPVRAGGCRGWCCPTAAEAQRRLLAAYLTSYGPATPAHLAKWLATSPAWTARLFERADLDEVVLEGEPAWVVRGDTDFEASEAPAVRLLPYFDAFGVGSQPRGLLFPGRAAERALAGSQAGNFPLLLLDGVVGGVWHLNRSGRKAVITVEPLGRLTKRHTAALGRRGRADRGHRRRAHGTRGWSRFGRAARVVSTR